MLEALLGRILDHEIEGAVNLRDLGGYRTPEGRVRTGRLYRSAVTHHLTEAGLRALANDLGVRVVVDLRNDHEIASDGVAAFEQHGITYRNFPISANTALTPDEQKARMLALRDGEISWKALYSQMLSNGGESFRGLFHEAAGEQGSLLFHCTGGRDRTGISAALLLAVLGVADDDIAQDYALTGDALVPHSHLFDRNLVEMEMTIEQWHRLVATTPEPIHETLQVLRDEHGGVAGYLESIGVPLSLQTELREKLVV